MSVGMTLAVDESTKGKSRNLVDDISCGFSTETNRRQTYIACCCNLLGNQGLLQRFPEHVVCCTKVTLQPCSLMPTCDRRVYADNVSPCSPLQPLDWDAKPTESYPGKDGKLAPAHITILLKGLWLGWPLNPSENLPKYDALKPNPRKCQIISQEPANKNPKPS